MKLPNQVIQGTWTFWGFNVRLGLKGEANLLAELTEPSTKSLYS